MVFHNISNTLKTKILLVILGAAIIAFMVFTSPIHQPNEYHQFADTLWLFGLPNFFNVASNIAYFIPGLLGMYYLHDNWQKADRFTNPNEAIAFYVFFAGGVMLAFGSGFYHIAPDNITLMADRFTMTIGFMGAVSFIIVERISLKWGLNLLPILLVVGMASVVYWIFPEMIGAKGDLRPYILVQLLSLVTILLIVVFYAPKYSHGRYIFYALGLYALAKFLEGNDHEFFNQFGHGFSGHTLKHLVSGMAIYYIYAYVKQRKAL